MYRMNNLVWEIRRIQSHSPILQRSDGVFTLGCCDRNTQTIYLSDRLDGDLLKKVLIHEVTHSAIFSYGIDLSLEQEELFCELVSKFGEEIFRVVNDVFYALSVA